MADWDHRPAVARAPRYRGRVLVVTGQAVPPSPLPPSRIDAYGPFILATLAKLPALTVARL